MVAKNNYLNLMTLVTQIVAAYVSNNKMDLEELPTFIRQIQNSLGSLNARQPYMLTTRTEPAVLIENSINADYIICLEDGKSTKMLKRHLKTYHNMTPDQYRGRWNLPANYPMVAPNYTKRRQSIAKSIGLGHHRKGKRKAVA